MQSGTPTTRTQRITAIVLSLLFLLMIFGFFLSGIRNDPHALLDSLRFSKAQDYLADPDDTGFFPMTAARIASLEHQLSESLPLTDRLGEINAAWQFSLGKQMISVGGFQVIRLPNGQLYKLTTVPSLSDAAKEVVALRERLDPDLPFLFAFIHPGFYNGGQQLQAGYDKLDTSAELADEILGIIREAGIQTMDSRTFFENSGYTEEDLEYLTDHHWTSLAALLAAQKFAEKINAMTGSHLDLSRLQVEAFDTESFDRPMYGEYGGQIGPRNTAPDYLTVFVPKYPTSLYRHSRYTANNMQDESGTFRDAMISWNRVDHYGFAAHGMTEGNEELVNYGDCEDMTIFVIKDSYAAPVARFLSLLARRVVVFDPRYEGRDVAEVIEQVKPDIVVVALSRLMMEAHGYTL